MLIGYFMLCHINFSICIHNHLFLYFIIFLVWNMDFLELLVSCPDYFDLCIRIQGAFLQSRWPLCFGLYGCPLPCSKCLFSFKPGEWFTFQFFLGQFDYLSLCYVFVQRCFPVHFMSSKFLCLMKFDFINVSG